jgi:hypothetical protein
MQLTGQLLICTCKHHIDLSAEICSWNVLSIAIKHEQMRSNHGAAVQICWQMSPFVTLTSGFLLPLPNRQLSVPGPLINFRAPLISGGDCPRSAVNIGLRCGWQYLTQPLLFRSVSCLSQCLRSLGRWDRGFGSHSRHGCLCAFILCLCRSVCR